jgi:glycerol uptake facilitator-like aquaporin
MEVHVNFLAVFVAALANYIIATIWYGALFSGVWKKLTGISEMKPKPVNIVLVFIGSFVMSFVLLHSIVFLETSTCIPAVLTVA